jgi:hypothetical protein
VTETDDEGYPHLITDIAGNCSSKTDYESLAEIQERLKDRQCLPKEQYVDSGRADLTWQLASKTGLT